MSTTTDLGKVGMTPKQTYNSTTAYERLDVVTYDGCSYVCLKDCTGVDVTNTEYWQLMAKKGEFTEEDKEAFKQAVVEESKTTINEHTETKKTELDTYTTNLKTSLETELDTYEGTKETELDTHKDTLETEMTNTKNSLVQEITDAQNDFDENVTAQTTAFNNNVTEKTNTFNSNAETKTTDFNTNASTKKTEYDENAATKLQEYNDNSTAKVNEFNENAESYATELEELAQQMPWSTTDIAESIHIEDSAKYSRNKLILFGNMTQEVSEAGNNIFDGIMEIGDIASVTGVDSDSAVRIRAKNYIDISGLTKLRVVRSDNYVGTDLAIGFRFYDANKNFINYKATTLGSILDLSILTDIEGYKYIRFIVTNTADTETYKYGLNKDASETFEEFIPNKPSLDYPSMPTVATGVQKIKLNDNVIATLDLADTELCKIKDADGNVVAQDRAVYREVDGVWKWQWEKNVAKLTTDENYKINKFALADYIFYCNVASGKLINTENFAISSNFKFDARVSGMTTLPKNYFAMQPSYDSIYFNTATINTLDELKTYLAENNIVFYYVLATPEYEDCTAEQSEVLDKLHKLQLEKGTNNIFVESENGVTTELQLTYMQDLQSKLNALEAMCVSNASEEV